MEDEKDAEVAVRKLDRYEFGRKGRRLRVEWTKQERDSRRPGGGKKPASNERPSRTLFVINFDPIDTKSKDLERHFEPHGRIANIRIRKNFAFIQFETQEEATKALEATNMSELLDRVITVEYAIRDDDANAQTFDRRGRDREMSPERGGSNRRRSPSPYSKERGSPDYGRGRVRDSPDYGRERVRDSPDYGRGRNRGSPNFGRGRDQGSPDGNGRDRGSPRVRGRDRDSPGVRGRDRGSPYGRGRDRGSPDVRGRDRGGPNVRGRDFGSPDVRGRDRGSPDVRGRDRGSPDVRGRDRGGSPVGRGRTQGSPDHGQGRVHGSPDDLARERGSPDIRVRESPENGRGFSKPEAGEIPDDVLDGSPANGRYRSRSRSPPPALPARDGSRS